MCVFYLKRVHLLVESVHDETRSNLCWHHLNDFRATSAVAGAMTLWPTLTEHHHQTHNFHHMMSPSAKPDCPTAKTGLMGGDAFLSLISSLFWISSLMLVNNAREDYLQELYPNVQSLAVSFILQIHLFFFVSMNGDIIFLDTVYSFSGIWGNFFNYTMATRHFKVMNFFSIATLILYQLVPVLVQKTSQN